MDPDVLAAIGKLREDGVLPAEVADRLARLARGGLVSAHAELRLILYAGVLLLTGGVGLLLKENLERIGPLAVAVSIGLAAAGCLLWAARHAPAFAWGETPAPNLAFDYLLLLGVMLGAADLAYVEVQFTPLGAGWPWHLLIVSLATGALAVRYDSRIIFSFSLSTFAAWRGVSTSLLGSGAWRLVKAPDPLRANAVACGLIFLLLGWAMKRTGRKPHFEPAATHLGWVAVLLALVSGIGTRTLAELLYDFAVLAVGAGLARVSFRQRRFTLAAFGLIAGYIGICAFFHLLHPGDILAACWYVATSLALLGGLFRVHRRLKVRP